MNGRWALALPLLIVALAGCIGDGDDDGNPSTGTPGTESDRYGPFEDDSHLNGGPRGFLPDTVTGMEFVANADDRNVKGIWINDDIAYMSGSAGLRIADVRDPSNPVLLAEDIADTGGGGDRDIDFMAHSNGRSYVAMSNGGVNLVDVTDPTRPVVVAATAVSSHNMAVVPGTDIVYNSRSISAHTPAGDGDLTTGQIDIVDFTDPENPVVTIFAFPAVITDPLGLPKVVDATTCHDITFAPERDLAFCGGVTETHIWDISDPLQPEIVQVIDFPLVQIHHGVWSARDGDMLILGDEFAGAAAGLCAGPVNPYATLWFFDISDLSIPTPLGYFAVDYNSVAEADTTLCTTHFGTVVEDRDMMVMGWYTAGVVLIDFSDPLQPVQVDHYRPEGDMSVWEARYYKGHIYTGDSVRGMDILKVI